MEPMHFIPHALPVSEHKGLANYVELLSRGRGDSVEWYCVNMAKTDKTSGFVTFNPLSNGDDINLYIMSDEMYGSTVIVVEQELFLSRFMVKLIGATREDEDLIIDIKNPVWVEASSRVVRSLVERGIPFMPRIATGNRIHLRLGFRNEADAMVYRMTA